MVDCRPTPDDVIMTNFTEPQMQQQSPQRRMYRPKDDRIIAGVSSSLGRRVDLSPWFFRIGFIVLAAFGGAGVVLYAVAWLLIPDEGSSGSLAGEITSRADGRDASTWIGIGLVALAGFIVLGWLGVLGNGLFWAGLLVVLGVLLYRGDLTIGTGGSSAERPQEAPPPPGGEAASSEAGIVPVSPAVGIVVDDGDGDEDGGGEPPVPQEPLPPHPAGPPPRPPVRRPRSILGALTFGAALLVLGGMAVAETAGWIDPSFADYVAAGVATLGAGLVIGAFVGRSVALIVVGVLLLPVLFFAQFVPFPIEGEVGEFRYAPDELAGVQSAYRLGAGSLTVDPRDPDLAGAEVGMEVEVGAGEIVVILPAGVAADVEASVGIGEVRVLDRQDSGIAVSRTVSVPGAGGRVVLDAQAGVGSIRIEQVGR